MEAGGHGGGLCLYGSFEARLACLSQTLTQKHKNTGNKNMLTNLPFYKINYYFKNFMLVFFLNFKHTVFTKQTTYVGYDFLNPKEKWGGGDAQ